MSEMKTCPYCLEEIPVRAIKCKYCESMVDEAPPKSPDMYTSAGPAYYHDHAGPDPVRQDLEDRDSYEPKKGSRLLVPLVIVAVLLLVAGAGAGYWFLFGDSATPVAEAVEGDDILGSWKGTTGTEEVYFQFQPNDMVSIAVPSEGYWFRTEYRLVRSGDSSFLELFHRGKDEWERTAELSFREPDILVMTDMWDGIVIDLVNHPEAQVGNMFRELRFER